jgi:hypothetical protein
VRNVVSSGRKNVGWGCCGTVGSVCVCVCVRAGLGLREASDVCCSLDIVRLMNTRKMVRLGM